MPMISKTSFLAGCQCRNLPAPERDQLRADLLVYCTLASRAMMDLVEALASLAADVRTA